MANKKYKRVAKSKSPRIEPDKETVICTFQLVALPGGKLAIRLVEESR